MAGCKDQCAGDDTIDPQPLGVIVDSEIPVDAIDLGGVCASAQIRCIPNGYDKGFTAGCKRYQIVPTGAGICTLTVHAGAASKTVSLQIDERLSCSDEKLVYTHDFDASTVFVETSDAATDAARE